MNGTLKDSALRYAKRGWPVFPLSPRGKKPLPRSNGFKDATTDLTVVEDHWRDNPEANIGLATGEAMGVWVLDIDGPEGSASLTALEEELGPLPETLDQQTGGGGRHLFFLWPRGREVRNKQSLRPGVDVRGNGGYIVAPPSVHPSGNPYQWTSGERGRIAEIPAAWLDLVCPPEAKPRAPWERVSAPRRRAPAPERTPIISRAERYLEECDPAVQGGGGHNALLWAARALVIGFELPDATALGLLWSHFNPRCAPPWREDVERDRRDFERKVAEARSTPSQKRPGWLLDELGLRDSTEALAQIARGQRSANLLLSSVAKKAAEDPDEIDLDEIPQNIVALAKRRPFPVEHFPGALCTFVDQVAESHQVDASFAALPALAVAAAAMGNTWRLELKRGFLVPPTIWVGLVAPSGANKSGPLREVVAPLQAPIPMELLGNSMLLPQGETVIGDATLEAVVSRLHENPRGLLVYRDELAGWANGFNAYKKGGGDEQAWLEFWGAGAYTVDRKTNDERIRIQSASVCVLGGIQPKILIDCFDPARFASGLVPRILIACPPRTSMFWTEVEVEPQAEKTWRDVVMWLRTRPFESFDPNRTHYKPHVAWLSAEAKAAYVTFFNSISLEIEEAADENVRGFMSKARVVAARLALIHHGMKLAANNEAAVRLEVDQDSVMAGVAWARWCLEEQIRVYGFASQAGREEKARYLIARIRAKHGGTATPRQAMKLNQKRFKNIKAATAAMDQLVELGYAVWDAGAKKKIHLLENTKEGTSE